MRWVRDTTGRFPRRPHFEPQELDGECEELVAAFLQARYGRVHYPLDTDDLTVLVEEHAAELDLYAELAEAGIEAETEFVQGRRPRVRVDRRLSEQPRRAQRLRATLAHELGHVLFHNFLWFFERGYTPSCRRPPSVDWMEWQAGYASGALLVPRRALAELVDDGPVCWERAAAGRALVKRVQAAFDVSAALARVRLRQRGHLLARPPGLPPRGRRWPIRYAIS